MKRRILLADDHEIILDGLRRILEPEFEIVGSVADGRALVEEVEHLRPEIAVADISMPLLNGLEALHQVKSGTSRTRFVFLTARADVTLATQAFRLGASGFVLKQAAAEELITAIREVLSGFTYVTPRIASEVLHNLMHVSSSESETPELTGREREVLQLLAEGMSLKEAAGVLHVSPRTVEFHKHNIIEKTGLRSTAELVRYAIRNGFIS